MFAILPVNPIDIYHEGLITAVLSILGWVMLFPIRTLINKIKREWDSTTSKLDEVHKELTTQRTNCLTTLQSQGKEQIDVLNKMSTTLEAIHLDQKEMAGFLKGRA